MAANDKKLLVILAGGRSSRLGQPKGLVGMNGKTWLEWQLAKAEQVGITHAIVVLGFNFEAYLQALPWLQEHENGFRDHSGLQLKVLLNPQPEYGPFSSLITALQNLEGVWPGLYLLPVDVPCPSAAVFEALSLDGEYLAVQPVFAGKKGHPVWLSSAYFPKLLALPLDAPDARLDWQLRGLPPEKLGAVAVDEEGILANLNTADDWERLLRSE